MVPKASLCPSRLSHANSSLRRETLSQITNRRLTGAASPQTSNAARRLSRTKRLPSSFLALSSQTHTTSHPSPRLSGKGISSHTPLVNCQKKKRCFALPYLTFLLQSSLAPHVCGSRFCSYPHPLTLTLARVAFALPPAPLPVAIAQTCTASKLQLTNGTSKRSSKHHAESDSDRLSPYFEL